MKDTDKELLDDLATLNHKQKLRIKELEREVVELKNIINKYTEKEKETMTTIKTLDGASITINGAEDIAKLTREELLDVTLRFIMENNRMEKCYLIEMLGMDSDEYSDLLDKGELGGTVQDFEYDYQNVLEQSDINMFNKDGWKRKACDESFTS